MILTYPGNFRLFSCSGAICLLLGIAAILGTRIAVAEAKPYANNNFSGLVEIGNSRHIYLECAGVGRPTVILEAGFRSNANAWTTPVIKESKDSIFSAIAKFTHVCTYDRPGTAGSSIDGSTISLSRSDAIPMPRTVQSVMTDLHSLLRAANESGPYIIVGHSLGGMFARLYASLYPHEVVGLVLVDAYPETIKQLLGSKWKAYRHVLIHIPQQLKNYKDIENFDFDAVTVLMEQQIKNSPLPQIPVIILSRGEATEMPSYSTLPSADLEQAWRISQDKLVASIPHSRHIIAKKSQHNIMFSEPKLVINAIHQVVNTVRSRGQVFP